jgi:hypothetical protein
MRFIKNYFGSLMAGIVFAVTIGMVIHDTAHAQAFAGSCAAIRGSYTGTLTGYASPPTGTIQYRVTTSCQVTLWTTAAISGTSNAATMTLTGTPYNLAPATSAPANQIITNVLTDNSANTFGCVQVSNATPTVITFSNTAACAGAMTNTGTKGLPSGWTITYTLY